MIRIIFENGDIVDCDNIAKIYIEEHELDQKTIVVKCLKEDKDETLA